MLAGGSEAERLVVAEGAGDQVLVADAEGSERSVPWHRVQARQSRRCSTCKGGPFSLGSLVRRTAIIGAYWMCLRCSLKADEQNQLRGQSSRFRSAKVEAKACFSEGGAADTPKRSDLVFGNIDYGVMFDEEPARPEQTKEPERLVSVLPSSLNGSDVAEGRLAKSYHIILDQGIRKNRRT